MDRVECIAIQLTLNGKEIKKHKHALAVLCNNIHFGEGDTLDIEYKFFVAYMQELVDRFRAIQDLCMNPEVVIDASCTDLEQGKILVYEVLKELELIITSVKEKQDASIPKNQMGRKRRNWFGLRRLWRSTIST